MSTNASDDQMIRDLRRNDGSWGAGRTRAIAAGLAAIAIFTTACSGGSIGPGVAGQGSSSPSTGASPSGDLREAQLAYARCMRDHGIADFPDPDPSAGPGIEGEPSTPQFEAAQEACGYLLPPPPSEEEQEQTRADGLRYAQCMRDHGFSNFPDPEPGEGMSFDLNLDEHPELDPRNPAFQEADDACVTDTQTSGGES